MFQISLQFLQIRLNLCKPYDILLATYTPLDPSISNQNPSKFHKSFNHRYFSAAGENFENFSRPVLLSPFSEINVGRVLDKKISRIGYPTHPTRPILIASVYLKMPFTYNIRQTLHPFYSPLKRGVISSFPHKIFFIYLFLKSFPSVKKFSQVLFKNFKQNPLTKCILIHFPRHLLSCFLLDFLLILSKECAILVVTLKLNNRRDLFYNFYLKTKIVFT